MNPQCDPLALTRELLRFNTINPPGDEQACAVHLAKLLEGAGYAVDYHEFARHRTSLIARLAGASEQPPLCFTGHIDTVPLGHAPWTRDPFAGELDGGRLYGRGATDMKSGVAAMVAAAIELADARPRSGLVLVLTAGEETGCEGAAYVAGRGDVLGQASAIVVGEPTANHPFVGHKGALWLRAKTTGKTAHGSMPEQGINAIYKAARAITQLDAFRFAADPHPVLGAATLNVGTVQGGLNVNSVPDEAVIGIDVRTVPGQKHADVLGALAEVLGAEVELEETVNVHGLWTDPQQSWMHQVFEIMEDVLDRKLDVRGATYFTDGAVLADAFGGVPTVILGPGEPALAHQTDEYCIVDRIDQAKEAYLRIARSRPAQ